MQPKREWTIPEDLKLWYEVACEGILFDNSPKAIKTLIERVAGFAERNGVLVEALSQAEVFVAEELGVRRASFLPSDAAIDVSDDAHYVQDALKVLDAIRAALANEPAPDRVDTEKR